MSDKVLQKTRIFTWTAKGQPNRRGLMTVSLVGRTPNIQQLTEKLVIWGPLKGSTEPEQEIHERWWKNLLELCVKVKQWRIRKIVVSRADYGDELFSYPGEEPPRPAQEICPLMTADQLNRELNRLEGRLERTIGKMIHKGMDLTWFHGLLDWISETNIAIKQKPFTSTFISSGLTPWKRKHDETDQISENPRKRANIYGLNFQPRSLDRMNQEASRSEHIKLQKQVKSLEAESETKSKTISSLNVTISSLRSEVRREKDLLAATGNSPKPGHGLCRAGCLKKKVKELKEELERLTTTSGMKDIEIQACERRVIHLEGQLANSKNENKSLSERVATKIQNGETLKSLESKIKTLEEDKAKQQQELVAKEAESTKAGTKSITAEQTLSKHLKGFEAEMERLGTTTDKLERQLEAKDKEINELHVVRLDLIQQNDSYAQQIIKHEKKPEAEPQKPSIARSSRDLFVALSDNHDDRHDLVDMSFRLLSAVREAGLK